MFGSQKKYLLATTLTASWLHDSGNSQSFCSKTVVPPSPLMTADRVVHSAVSKGSRTSSGQKAGVRRSPSRGGASKASVSRAASKLAVVSIITAMLGGETGFGGEEMNPSEPLCFVVLPRVKDCI